MRRNSHTSGAGLFQGREFYRLATAISLLAIVGMLIQRSSDPKMWRWLADDDSGRSTAAVAAVSDSSTNAEEQERIVPGPTDEDPEQKEGAAEEFQVITDNQPLDAAEMSPYWRLLRWSRAQSFDEMRDRARRDVLITHLAQVPDRYRGELIELKLHVKRTLTYEAPRNSAGVKDLYEAWGWNDDSGSNFYVVLFSDLPANLPLGDDVHEDAVFVGYFLKKMSYVDKLDNKRWAPLLVGRVRWQETPGRLAMRQQAGDYFWPTVAGASAILVLVIGSWVKGKWVPRRQLELQMREQAAIENWIEHVDSPEHEAVAPTNVDLRPALDWLDDTGNPASEQGVREERAT